jgi:hypothetical protein
MAFTRYQVATSSSSQQRIFRWAVKNRLWAAIIPWFIGLFFSLLHFVDFSTPRLTFQAFFDPISKLTILLPASSNPLNFYLQAGLGAVVSLMTITYSVRAWSAINENAKNITSKGLIR